MEAISAEVSEFVLFYDYFNGAAPELMPVTRGDIPASDVPFQAWRAFEGRKEY